MYKIEIIENNFDTFVVLLDDKYDEIIKFQTTSIKKHICNKKTDYNGKLKKEEESEGVVHVR